MAFASPLELEPSLQYPDFVARYCSPTRYERALELLEEDPETGLEEIKRLARKYPKDPAVRYALGIAHLELDEVDEALPHLEWVARKHETPEVYRELIVAYLLLDMSTHALRVARLAREQGLRDVPPIEEPPSELVPEGMKEKDRFEFERARMETLRGQVAGVKRMAVIAERFPAFQATHNLVATGYFALGDLARYHGAAWEALERAPQNIHALLNVVRLELLERGQESARALLPRIRQGLVSREVGIVNGELARAQALSYLGDAEGVRRALDAYYHQDEDADNPVAERLEDYLELHADDPQAPLMRLHELLAGHLSRWRKLGERRMAKAITDDLKGMPGLLGLIPQLIGYEEKQVALMLVLALLSDDAPPATAEPWSEVLRRVAQEGPGMQATRLELFFQLGQLGFIDTDTPFAFEGTERGVRLLELELTREPIPIGLADDDQELFEEAHRFMRDEDFEAARPLLQGLQESYPQSASVAFNLAMSELVAGGRLARQARERLERLLREHPDYLFARAHLAVEAIGKGDVARAEKLLVLPEERRRFHVQEYAVFLAAQGQLLLAQGKPERVHMILDTIAQLVGEETTMYRALEEETLGYALKILDSGRV